MFSFSELCFSNLNRVLSELIFRHSGHFDTVKINAVDAAPLYLTLTGFTLT